MLDALVLADGAAEDDAFAGIGGCAMQCVAAQADRFGGDQDTFGVEAVEQVAEAFAFLADAVFVGDEEVVDEDRVRIHGVAAHLRDAAHFDAGAVEVGVEQGHAAGRLLALRFGCGAVSSKILSATWAELVQILRPLMT